MTKAELHRLVDELPDIAVDPIGGLLKRAVEDPMVAILDAAPVDDEPLTADEDGAITESRAAIGRGDGISLEQVRKEFPTDD